MSHTIRDKKKLLTRIRRIKGQTEALEKILIQETECTSVLQQIAAIRGAINGLMVEVLEGHIRNHLTTAQDVSASQQQIDTDQVIRILRTYLK